MKIEKLQQVIEERYDGLKLIYTYAESSYFYNSTDELPKGIYFTMLKENDGVNDKASDLTREGMHRLSFGIINSA